MMKMRTESENIKIERKLLKPQVERRRRERMNLSLENLRSLLLQGPEHNSSTQRRIEKAEILECTVLFLQNSVAVAKKPKDAGGEKLPFIDGFSTCLQKAAHFLLDEGEVRGLDGSISATLCQRLSQPCVPANIRMPVRIQNSSRIQVPRSAVQHYLQQRQKQQQNSVCTQGLSSACRNIVVHPNRIPFRSAEPNALECHNKTPTVAQPTSHSQTVWRPWP